MSELVGYLIVCALGVVAGYSLGRREREHHGPVDAHPTATSAGTRLRNLDTIRVICEDQSHQAGGHVPSILLSRNTLPRDLRTMRDHGWGSARGINVCFHHNAAGTGALDHIHLVCNTVDCGERETLRVITAATLSAGFGRARSIGWRNTGDDQLKCPIHAGVRARPVW